MAAGQDGAVMRARAMNRSAIRDRVKLIAHERGLTADEIRSALKTDDTLLDFAFRHGLSIDWPFHGDLRGRLRMIPGTYDLAGPTPTEPQDRYRL
jgi:hypothetical protein